MSSGRSEVAATRVWIGEETRLGVGTGSWGPDCIRVRSLDKALEESVGAKEGKDGARELWEEGDGRRGGGGGSLGEWPARAPEARTPTRG